MYVFKKAFPILATAISAFALSAQTVEIGGGANAQSISFEQPSQEPPPARESTQDRAVTLDEKGKASLKAPLEFSANIVPSLQSPALDWWFNIPPNSVPHIAKIGKVFYGQPFALFPFIDNAITMRGKFNVQYSITAYHPDGTSTLYLDKANFSGSKKFDNIILACPDVLEMRFDKKYPTGVYKFKISATDLINGKKSESESAIELAHWLTPQPLIYNDDLGILIRNFYLNPSPVLLWQIFFSGKLNLEQKDAPNALNYTYMGFFRAAFKRNMFLIPFIRDAFPSASKLDRIKTILLFRILELPKIDESLLTSYEKKYDDILDKAEFPNAYEAWHPIIGAAQIDMLWGEFFANGTYRPVRRIMDLLANVKEAEFAHEMIAKKKRPQSRSEWARFMVGILHRAALSTISATAAEVPLVEKYVCWALDNNDLPDVSSKILIPIFGTDDTAQRHPLETQTEKLNEWLKPKFLK